MSVLRLSLRMKDGRTISAHEKLPHLDTALDDPNLDMWLERWAKELAQRVHRLLKSEGPA